MREDREVDARLRAYESRLPEADPPDERLVHRSRDRWVVGVAGGVAIAAVALVGLVAYNLAREQRGIAPAPSGFTSPAPESTQPAPASSAATATHTPQPPATPATGWTVGRVVEPGADPGTAAVLFGLQWHEVSGWIAYGIQENTEQGRPGVWTSNDGVSWALATLPDGLAGHHVADVTYAEVDGSVLFLAVLTDYERTRILVSNDATVWRPPLTTTSDGPAVLSAAAHGPAGFVAVGSVASLGMLQAPGLIWSSPQGEVWSEYTPAAFQNATPMSIEVVGERYVAVGFPNHESPPMNAWISSDGREWEPYEVVPSAPVGCICVTTDALGSQMAAVGVQEEPFAAFTQDGTTWRREVLDATLVPRPTAVDVLDDGSVIVTGALEMADGPHDLLIWVRDAGSTTWRTVEWRAQLSEPEAAGEITLGRDAFVAAGSDRAVILIADGTVLATTGRTP